MEYKDIVFRFLWLINTVSVEDQLAESQFIKGESYNLRNLRAQKHWVEIV